MKRKRLLLLGALVLSVALYAQGTSEQNKKPGNLTIVVPNTTVTEPYEEIFKNYTAETGIKVELQVLPSGEEYGRFLQTRFATKDYPDLFQMDPGTKQYTKFGVDKLYDWTGDKLFDNVLDATTAFQTYQGKIYGVPWGGTGTYGVYYNKAVFKALGVSVPQNYADFISILKKAKVAGYIPVYCAAKSEWPLQVFSLIAWPSFVDPLIGTAGVEKLQVNQLKLNEIPALKDVFTRYVALKDEGLFQDNYSSGTYDEQMESLGTGKTAVCFQISNFIPALISKFGKEYVVENIGWFPLPSDTDEGVAMLTPAQQILVPSEGKNVEAAADLVRYMVKKENQEIYYKSNSGIPVYKDVNIELLPYEKDVLSYANKGKAMVNIQNRVSSSFTDFPKILQNMLITGDVQVALDQLNENYQKTGNARALEGF